MAANLDERVLKAFQTAFETKSLTGIQSKCIGSLFAFPSQDVLIRARTGTGKTLAYLLPLLHFLLTKPQNDAIPNNGITSKTTRAALGTQVLVLVPTRELVVQTQQMLTRILAKFHGSDHWIVSGALSGGDRKKSEKERLRKGVHIVIGTPGRVMDHLKSTASWQTAIKACRWIVLDEADRLLDSGFEAMVREILQILKKLVTKAPRIILCSATVPEGIAEVAGTQLVNPLLLCDGEAKKELEKNAPSIPGKLDHFFVATPTKFRLAVLCGLLKDIFKDSPNQLLPKVLLFTICCDTVEFLFTIFNDVKLGLLPRIRRPMLFKLHGNLEHKERLQTFARFISSKQPAIMICTDIAARGLNLHQITDIIQYDAPCDINDYVHRAGRTAREGESGGRSILFLMPSERDYLSRLNDKKLKVNQLAWMNHTESFLNMHPATKNITNAKSNGDEEDVLEEKDISLRLRRLNLSFLESTQKALQQKAELSQNARQAYLSFVRAYATHSKNEKDIFHIKKLHLGHLAATFLLGEAPKSFSNKPSKDNGSNPRPKKALPMKNYKASAHPPKRIRIASEFEAGDLSLSFMKPRTL